MIRVRATLGLIAMLAACDRGAVQPQAEPGAKRIDCAIGEGSDFGPDCLVEKVSGEQGPEFIVRHPDGGFQRLRIAPNRSGMIAISGADEAVNELVGEPKVLQVTVGEDRYRFPADIDAGK
ncbi:hypothetical protein IDJ81_11525 [Tsuneonella flava]|uniref:Lipoprotein n=1 Tax=Tsuneonella flava TaxID=2055955 RepID=A0ABX7K7K7_9SPHN|nr:hypothetical protein [Tsuneonella flava]QSB43969.1 hypothetical protein IDJ81_11525 [Tsuneonella flava]